MRIKPDGSVPGDNPFVGRNDAWPEIWSYGHRNSQGAAIHPVTGKLWEHEHGPRGGDEINIPEKGKNYGWPVIGYGIDYSGAKIHESTSKSGMEQPIKYWVPSIAPSGMAFYAADLFPAWKGSLFVGALAGQMLVRLTLDGEKVTGEERLLAGLARAHPRRSRRARRRALSGHRQFGAGESCGSRRRNNHQAPAYAETKRPAVGLTSSLPGNTASASARSSTRR